jgi:DNA-binding transcriptional LysR family regulator
MLDDARDLRFFVAITEAGSLAEAARRLDVTPSAVSQHLRQLEERLGLRLVHRTTRGLSLTDEGTLLHEGAVAILADMDRLTERVRSRSGAVAGKLDVCGPLGFGRRYLAAAVAEFHDLHPALRVSLYLSDAISAADAPRFDLIVHIGQLPDSSMIAHPLAPNARLLCAAPAYLARKTAPASPDELPGHDCLVLRENQEDVTLWRLRRGKQEAAVRVPAAMWSNDGEVVKEWAMGGKGIMLRSEWDVADHVREGRLVRVLPDWKLDDADVVALVDHRRHMSARVRLFVTFLQARFKPSPAWRT